jgi:hypothetical protein
VGRAAVAGASGERGETGQDVPDAHLLKEREAVGCRATEGTSSANPRHARPPHTMSIAARANERVMTTLVSGERTKE